MSVNYCGLVLSSDCDAENESLESLILSIKASTVCVESVASRLIITLHTLIVICIMHLA